MSNSLQVYKPAKYAENDWLTRWHLEVLTKHLGGIQTGSSVLGGETPESDIDVFLAMSTAVSDWLKRQEFACDGSQELYAGNEFISYRHPQSWINVITLDPEYYPCFKHCHDVAMCSDNPDLKKGKAYRKEFFRREEVKWLESHPCIYRKRTLDMDGEA